MGTTLCKSGSNKNHNATIKVTKSYQHRHLPTLRQVASCWLQSSKILAQNATDYLTKLAKMERATNLQPLPKNPQEIRLVLGRLIQEFRVETIFAVDFRLRIAWHKHDLTDLTAA